VPAGAAVNARLALVRQNQRARIESGLFQGARVSLPGDTVVAQEATRAVNAYHRGADPQATRAEARGAIRVAQKYLGATYASVMAALEIVEEIQ